MITKYLNPKNDVAFRHIFGEDKHKHILVSMLNAVLKNELHKPIAKIELKPTIQNPLQEGKKNNIIDVLCRDEDGCQYIIEMQLGKQTNFQDRATFYSAKLYSNQLVKGEDYSTLKRVIFLAFADYILFPNEKRYKNTHVTKNKDTNKEVGGAFTYVYVELPKFRKKHKGDPSKLTLEEKFYYFLDNATDVSDKELPNIIGKDKVIEKAFNALNRFGWSNDEIMLYEAIEKNERDYNSGIIYAQKKGREEGEQQGLEKGKKEIAIKLIQKGKDTLQEISDLTGLSLKELDKIKKSIR